MILLKFYYNQKEFTLSLEKGFYCVYIANKLYFQTKNYEDARERIFQ